MRPPKSLTITGLVVAAFCALAIGAQQLKPEPAPQPPPDSGQVQPALKTFSEVYGLIEQNYATPVRPDPTIYGPPQSNSVGAIPAMLRTLDPHSNFFDPTSFAQMQEEMRGDYYGVGMVIGERPDKNGKMEVVVEQPLPDSPAFTVGLRPGDAIIAVDGKSTAGMNTERVRDVLRGPANTSVEVTVTREGAPHPLQFTLTRQKITQHSVDSAFMLRPGIAYIHINTFNDTTDPELSEALDRLGQENFKGLILDLRGNRGGLLNQAVGVASHFLRKGQLVVYHSGRSSPEQKYYAVDGEQGPEYPMIVLIDNDTASAAEIVTGALQDHDRALIMGQQSFGKGLVQTEEPLSDKTMLLLTTAHYYTPSGRLIQREYSNLSTYDYYNHYNPNPLPPTQPRLTDGGRQVFGGRGITPDVVVPPVKLNPVEQKLMDAGVFGDFGRSYLASHKTVAADFRVNGKTLDEFRKLLPSEGVTLSPQEFKQNEAFIREHIRTQLVGVIYGTEAAQRITVENDPLVARALASFDQARQIMVQAHRYMASRGISH